MSIVGGLEKETSIRDAAVELVTSTGWRTWLNTRVLPKAQAARRDLLAGDVSDEGAIKRIAASTTLDLLQTILSNAYQDAGVEVPREISGLRS